MFSASERRHTSHCCQNVLRIEMKYFSELHLVHWLQSAGRDKVVRNETHPFFSADDILRCSIESLAFILSIIAHMQIVYGMIPTPTTMPQIQIALVHAPFGTIGAAEAEKVLVLDAALPFSVVDPAT